MLNGVGGRSRRVEQMLHPFSRHAEAINRVQRWFVEQTRLGIPVDFSNEGIHGLNHTRATPLPAPIGVGSTWNRDLVRQAGTIVGREARALGYTNVYAPILDLARDPRWGRTLECYGEDPYLVAELGTEMARGIQSQGVASTLKHYAVYSVPKGGRDGDCRTDPHVAPRELHQLYLYPFRRVVREARPMGVMSSYNDWDGVPVTASHYFLTFRYSNLSVTPLSQSTQGEYTVSLDVTNTGRRAGDEVVQLYVTDRVSSVTTYESQLRGFERVSLEPGQTRRVTFRLTPDDLQLLDRHMQWTVEPGKFDIKVGASSQDIRLTQTIEAVDN